jgi:hypothetical protein
MTALAYTAAVVASVLALVFWRAANASRRLP